MSTHDLRAATTARAGVEQPRRATQQQPLTATEPLDEQQAALEDPGEPEPVGAHPAEQKSPHARPCRQGKGLVTITAVVPNEVSTQLGLLANHRGTTSQKLLHRALYDLHIKLKDGAVPTSAGSRRTRLAAVSRQDTVRLTYWLTDKQRKYWKQQALLNNTSVQKLFSEAINDLFEKYRVPASVP